MKKSLKFVLTFLILTVALAAVAPLKAQQQNPSATVPVRMVVTVLGRNYSSPPTVSRDDVRVFEGKEQLTVSEWTPARGPQGSLDFAVMIDENTNTNLGLQLADIGDFIKELPSTARAGVFYASNATAQVASDFTADHAAAAKALRLPLGNVGAYSSIYLSLMDLIKRWPAASNRREMLVVSDGIDRFRGDPFSPDVQSTVEQAQKAGIMIHTIYATGVGRFSRNLFRLNYGQSNLAQIADETGGEAFFQGTYTPIDYMPYLKNLQMVLNNQYLLTFLAKPGKKAELKKFRVRTELKDAEISAADAALVPAAE
ncbi:MAG: hypothetical protein WBC04_12520 [Candidatus Acidiferrales bacterium]